MVLGTAGLAAATHNTVGARTVVGDPDPVPTQEPDTDESLRPIYHSANTSNLDVSNDPPFFGDYERIAAPDQSGLGLGDWIGYINGVVEYPGPGFSRCLALNDLGVVSGCTSTGDPLYRVSPEPGDEQCDEALERTNDTNCSGADHEFQLDFWPPVIVQPPDAFVEATGSSDAPANSGAMMPGLYSFYVYLFGEGTGPAAGPTEDPSFFEYLSDDLCETPENGGQGHGTANCNLIRPEDITKSDRTDRVHSESGVKQSPVVCVFAPHFTTLSGAAPGDCQDISEFNMYVDHSDSGLYAGNKPGWYIQSGFIDTGTPITSTITKSGERSDVSRIFSFYVNPVNVDDSLFCAAPKIATNAPDQLDTGIVQNEDGSWSEVDPTIHYLVEGLDLDVYTSDLGTIQREANSTVGEVLDNLPDVPPAVQDLINAAVDTVNEALSDGGNVTAPLFDATAELQDRTAPTTGNTAEPNAGAADTSFSLIEEGPANQCPAGGLTEDTTTANEYMNYINAAIDSEAVDQVGGDYLHDYTYTDENASGLPHNASDQNANPWHPDEYTFGGTLTVMEDRNGNRLFDGCPAGEQFPGANQDRCVGRLHWDFANPLARFNDDPVPGIMEAAGFENGTGMYFVLKLTGPTVIESTETSKFFSSGSTDDIEDRTIVIEGEGQHCIVGTSVGLTEDTTITVGDETFERNQADRFRQIIGLEPGVDDNAIMAKLCGDVTGQTFLIKDAFADGGGPGGFAAGLSWIRLNPGAHGLDLTEGDSLEVNALLTVQSTGDTITDKNLKLGSHAEGDATVVNVWDNDDVTYKWTDLELFQSEPVE